MRADLLEGDASRFAGLTFPRYAPLLQDVRFPLVAAGLSLEERPVALALASVEERQARLLSVSVEPQARGAGYGAKLLGFLQDALLARADLIWTEYTSSLPQVAAFEGVLRRAGWEAPNVHQVRVSGLLGPVIDLTRTWPGLSDARDARLGITFAPWAEAAVDEEAIAGLEREEAFLPGLAPALYASRIDPSISLAIRQDGRLIGWLLGERLPDAVGGTGSGVRLNWPTAYVTRSLWHTGVLIRAFVRGLHVAQAIYGDDAAASLYAALPRVMAMVRQRSAGGPISVIEIRQAVRLLHAP